MNNLKLLVTEDEFKDIAQRMEIRTGGETCQDKNLVKLAIIEMMPKDFVEDETLVEVPSVWMNMMPVVLIVKHAFKTYGVDVLISRVFKIVCAFAAQKKHLNPSFSFYKDDYRTIVWTLSSYLENHEKARVIEHSLTFDFELFLAMNYGAKDSLNRIEIDKSIRRYMIDSARKEGSLIQDDQTVMLDYNCFHARRALMTYAMSIKDEQPKLSIQLIKSVNDFEFEHTSNVLKKHFDKSE